MRKREWKNTQTRRSRHIWNTERKRKVFFSFLLMLQLFFPWDFVNIYKCYGVYNTLLVSSPMGFGENEWVFLACKFSSFIHSHLLLSASVIGFLISSSLFFSSFLPYSSSLTFSSLARLSIYLSLCSLFCIVREEEIWERKKDKTKEKKEFGLCLMCMIGKKIVIMKNEWMNETKQKKRGKKNDIAIRILNSILDTIKKPKQKKISNEVRQPPEFKHIRKGRKRN